MKTYEQLATIRDELKKIRNMAECLAYSNGHMAGLDIDRVLFAYEKAFDLLNKEKQPLTEEANRQLAIIQNNATNIVKIKYELVA